MAALKARGSRVIGQARQSRDADTVPADFCKPGAAQELWDAALAKTGGTIDVLVNNAGLFEANPLDASDIEWLDGWETPSGSTHQRRAAEPLRGRHWQERGVPGRIVHVASRAVIAATARALALRASKGGAGGARRSPGSMPRGILSFAIAPGFTDTAMPAIISPAAAGPACSPTSRSAASPRRKRSRA